MRQCVILAGGLGTRLGALTRDTPKPLLDVAGRPFLAWLMREALRWGVEEFLLLTGHLGHQVQTQLETLAALLPRPVAIRMSDEPAPAGTGGGFASCARDAGRPLPAADGDSLFLADLGPALMEFFQDTPDIACRMVLRAVPNAGRYGVATLESNTRHSDQVSGFRERSEENAPRSDQ